MRDLFLINTLDFYSGLIVLCLDAARLLLVIIGCYRASLQQGWTGCRLNSPKIVIVSKERHGVCRHILLFIQESHTVLIFSIARQISRMLRRSLRPKILLYARIFCSSPQLLMIQTSPLNIVLNVDSRISCNIASVNLPFKDGQWTLRLDRGCTTDIDLCHKQVTFLAHWIAPKSLGH